MDDEVHGRDFPVYFQFQVLGSLMGLINPQQSAEQDVQIPIDPAAGETGSELMKTGKGIRHGFQNVRQFFLSGLGDAGIHQTEQGVLPDHPGRINNNTADYDGKKEIKKDLTGQVGQQNGQEGGRIGVNVAGIMKGVGLEGLGTGAFPGFFQTSGYKKTKAEGKEHDPQIPEGILYFLMINPSVYRGHNDIGAGKDDDHGLKNSGQVLRLTVAVVVCIIGGLGGFSYGQKTMADILTSKRLSSPEERTAMEPEMRPTENLPPARIKAEQ